MNKLASSCSDISLDSLENDFKNKSTIKEQISDDKMDTILVPFYENDVLMKVPKLNKHKQNKPNHERESNSKEPKSYLLNKYLQTSKKTTYLDMFRKRISGNNNINKKEQTEEIRSTSPQVGDTERESIDDAGNNNETEFYNTEAYNEMYYEKLINQDMEYYLDRSYEELKFTDDLECKSQDDIAENNLKSVSEVSQPRRHARRATAQPIQNLKLGGLGPDMENIRPRLERARSLQRYSEKVRMANRLKIYKKSVEEENTKKHERQASASRRNSATRHDSGKKKTCTNEDQNKSYLVNKSVQQKTSIIRKIYQKSRSADQNKRIKDNQMNINIQSDNQDRGDQNIKKCKTARGNVRHKDKKVDTKLENSRSKSSSRDQGVNTDRTENNAKIQPVEISFLVNIGGGLRPSSALRTLEEKHKQYQDKVKGFTAEF
ncbi:unnamed protein product [Colias eurytheme]|nr:unnamed protein product [Colias eurytheme]